MDNRYPDKKLPMNLDCQELQYGNMSKTLKKMVMKLDTVRKKGYYLIAVPDRVNEANVKKHLKNTLWTSELIILKHVVSTQLIAHEEAQNGAPNGTVIISEEQTSGKGRMSTTMGFG